MPERRIVNAIVLRSVNYRDFDRILTLFSREEGKSSAAARGAHRAKSPLAAASTQFTAGEFALEFCVSGILSCTRMWYEQDSGMDINDFIALMLQMLSEPMQLLNPENQQ